ncbi:Predicted dehydrogenase [Tenacibaculum sp. MAR_2009_124]|uniref:Gfo/Idh/MocA family protein n=1 Tax=Tenacibaculum sp. MAR_2009_124 TaxID=1250059 RepID=UPI0008963C8F|nr:Gfo/Idh/MocA family oxidoreductase [Tenacibaculum sp. MAR_2009_124]SEB69544.1 Predicted dehydrogenase [Tenacibaculum sp. MAR_2009_124]
MLKFAVVGCGNLALKYSIPALINSRESELIVCVNTSEKPKKIIEQEFNIPFEISFKEAIRKYDFDAVYISTPTGSHAEIVTIAAHNKKHILCEKSLGVNPNEVSKMIEICKKNKVAIFEGFMYQFHTQHRFVKKLIDKGEIGTPLHFKGWFGFPPINPNDFRYDKNKGGGAVLDAGSYTVHAARHFFKREPIKGFSIIENEGYKVEIRGNVLLNFDNNRTASLAFGFNNMYQNKYTIWGTKGIITLERAFAVPPDFSPICILEKQGYKEKFTLEPCNHFIEEIKYFVDNFVNEKIKKEWRNEALIQSHLLNLIKEETLF